MRSDGTPDLHADAQDSLIGRLAADLRPAPRVLVLRRLLVGLAGGAAVSALLTVLILGLRPDMAEAIRGPMFWVKLGYTLALGCLGLWACERLARPAGIAGGRVGFLVAVVLTFAGVAAWRWMQAPAPERMPMMMGGSFRVCPWYVLAFSAPPLAGLAWAVRGLAPTRLRLTGTVVGLAAGGAGAAAYALHCTESAMPFLAIWYTLGVAMAGAVGALLGPRLLRW